MENICDLGVGKVFLGYKKYTSKKNSKLDASELKAHTHQKTLKNEKVLTSHGLEKMFILYI